MPETVISVRGCLMVTLPEGTGVFPTFPAHCTGVNKILHETLERKENTSKKEISVITEWQPIIPFSNPDPLFSYQRWQMLSFQSGRQYVVHVPLIMLCLTKERLPGAQRIKGTWTWWMFLRSNLCLVPPNLCRSSTPTKPGSCQTWGPSGARLMSESRDRKRSWNYRSEKKSNTHRERKKWKLQLRKFSFRVLKCWRQDFPGRTPFHQRPGMSQI